MRFCFANRHPEGIRRHLLQRPRSFPTWGAVQLPFIHFAQRGLKKKKKKNRTGHGGAVLPLKWTRTVGSNQWSNLGQVRYGYLGE